MMSGEKRAVDRQLTVFDLLDEGESTGGTWRLREGRMLYIVEWSEVSGEWHAVRWLTRRNGSMVGQCEGAATEAEARAIVMGWRERDGG
jgi:hypothetical protein